VQYKILSLEVCIIISFNLFATSGVGESWWLEWLRLHAINALRRFDPKHGRGREDGKGVCNRLPKGLKLAFLTFYACFFPLSTLIGQLPSFVLTGLKPLLPVGAKQALDLLRP
jgi:hypothetical protein